MSPRWFDGKDHLALDTGGGPIARLWSTALSGLVDIGYVKATGTACRSTCRRPRSSRRSSFEWKIPQWTTRIERDRARTYFQAYAAAGALTSSRRRWPRSGPATPRRGSRSRCPTRAIGCGFTEAVRGVLSHHMVIRGRQDRQLPPVPADAVEREPARHLRHARARTRTRCMNTPIFEENDLEHFKGIDIMRAVRSFDPCLPCGVHMYLGKGKVLKQLHSPTQVADPTLAAEPRPEDGRRPQNLRAAATGSSSCSTSCRPRRIRDARARRGAAAPGHRALRRRAGTHRRARRGRGARVLVDALADDELVASLLLVHGLHPDGVDGRGSSRRSSGAAASSPPHGGDVELLDVDADVGAVRLRLLGAATAARRRPSTLQRRGRGGDRRRRAGDR